MLSLLQVNEQTRAYVAIAARVSPIIFAAAGAFAVYEAAARQAAAEQDSFASSIALSNNAAGATTEQLTAYAAQIGAVSGNTVKAATAIGALVESGKVGADNLRQFGQASLDATKAFGTTAQDTAKNFADIADSPVAALGALHALTPALESQIEDLIGQGKAIDAVSVAQKAYSQQLEEQVQIFSQSESTYTRGWESIKEFADKAWQAMLGGGQSQTLQQQLDALVKKSQTSASSLLQGISFGPLFGPTGAATPDPNADQEKALQFQIDQQKTRAAQAAAAAAALQQQLRDNATAVVGDQEKIALGNIQLSASIESVTATLSKQTAAIQTDSSVLEALHGAGLITDKQYYDTRRDLIQADTDAQVASLNKQIALTQQQTALTDTQLADLRKRASGDLTPQGAANVASIDSNTAQNDAQGAAKVQALRDQIALAQAGGQQKVTQATVDQTAATARLQAQLDQVTASSQLYIKSLTSQYSIEEASVALSDNQASQLSALADIQAHFDDARNNITKQLSKNTISPEQANAAIAAQNSAQAKADAAFAQHFQNLTAAQGDWLNGAKKAFADYQDAGANAAALAGTAVTSGLNDINDALVNTVTTGKLEWKSLMESLITDFAKFEVRILESKAFAEIGSLFGGGGFLSAADSAALGSSASSSIDTAFSGLFGFKDGGSFDVGGSGGTDSQIVSFKATPGENVKVGSGGAAPQITINNYATVTSPQVTKSDVVSAMKQTSDATVGRLQDMKRRGTF